MASASFSSITSMNRGSMKRSKPEKHGKRGKKETKRPKNESPKKESPRKESSEEESLSDVEMTFELFNMDVLDFHSVRLLLQHAFLKQGVEVGSVADLICDRLSEYIGTCVKQSSEDDALGFVTIIPLHLHKQIGAFFAKHYGDGFESCGLLLMERMMNMPVELAKPMYQQLLDDYREAIAEDVALFKLDNVLIYTPIYWEVESELEGHKKKGESGPFYYQEEMESLKLGKTIDIVMHDADYTADSKRAFSDRGIKQGRRIAMITWHEFVKFVKSL